MGHSDQGTSAHSVLWKSWVFSFRAHELRASSEDVNENVGRQGTVGPVGELPGVEEYPGRRRDRADEGQGGAAVRAEVGRGRRKGRDVERDVGAQEH